MKHAGSEALDQLEDVLEDLRGIDGLVEKKRGVFYRRSAVRREVSAAPADEGQQQVQREPEAEQEGDRS